MFITPSLCWFNEELVMQEAPRRLLFIVMEDVLHHCQKLMFSANYFILSINFKYCIYFFFMCIGSCFTCWHLYK